MKELLLLSLVVTLASCSTLPDAVKGKDPIRPGQTAFEAMFINGFPTGYAEFAGDVVLQFPNKSVWVVRAGRISHQMVNVYSLKIDSIKAATSSSGRTYYIRIPKGAGTDLYYASYAEMLKRAMERAGLKVVPSESAANSIVSFTFDQSGKEDVTVSTSLVPVTDYTFTTATQLGEASTNYFDSRFAPIGFGKTTFAGSGNMSSVTTRMAPVMNTTREYKYSRALEIKALSAQGNEALWTLNVLNSGASGDRRQNFAALASGAMRFLGVDSGGEVAVYVSSIDPMIGYLRTGDDSRIQVTQAQQWKGIDLDFCSQEAPGWRGAQMEFTPLMLAAKLGQIDIAKGLMDCGHRPEIPHFLKPIVIAAKNGNGPLFEEFLSRTTKYQETVEDNLKLLKDKSYAAKYSAKFPKDAIQSSTSDGKSKKRKPSSP